MNVSNTRVAMAAIAQIRTTRGMMAKIASSLKISQQAVCVWEKVPPQHVIAVEKITGIPREKLRPDLLSIGRNHERARDHLPHRNRRRVDGNAHGAGAGRKLSAAALVVDNRARRSGAHKGGRADVRGGDAGNE